MLGGHQDTVETLAPGCDVNAAGGVKGSALVIAASTGHTSLLKLLFKLGVRPGPRKDMANALVAAAAKGHDDAIDILLEKDADVNAAGRYKVGLFRAFSTCSKDMSYKVTLTRERKR